MTRYVLLGRSEKKWEEIGRVNARSAVDAIRVAATERGVEGAYAAVRERSWRPQQVEIAQEPRVTVKASS